ncbi:MAG: adenine phosphoribosyltransferase [Rhodanobacteraceae bacterium]
MTVEGAGFHSLIRTIPDFPQQGVAFRDIMPMLADPAAFKHCIDALAAPWLQSDVELVLAIEARGFLFGSALAQRLGAGLVPLRKAGKLPGSVVGKDYVLEYGSARLEAQNDVVDAGARAVILDDVLATGGTLAASLELARSLQLEVLGASVVIEIAALDGRRQWPGDGPLHALVQG